MLTIRGSGKDIDKKGVCFFYNKIFCFRIIHSEMSEDLESKQQFLRVEILEAAIDPS